MKMKMHDLKPIGCSKSSYKKEVYSHTRLLHEQEKSQVNNLTLHLKELEKGEQTKHKVIII